MSGTCDVVNDESLTSFVLLWFGQSVRTSGIWLFHEMLKRQSCHHIYEKMQSFVWCL